MVTEKIGGHSPAWDGSCPIGMASAIRCEADAIFNTSVFVRSPVIAKLLHFLIEETLAGRADILKSYTVAVDGLGRSSDYDSSDSYARVQMGRLRKMLQSHYAEHGPVGYLCIYIQAGSYTVRLGKLSVGYPTLYRPLSEIDAHISTGYPSSTAHNNDGDGNAVSLPMPVPLFRRKPLISIAIWLGFILGTLSVLFWQNASRANSPQLSPILELVPIDSGGNPELARTARLVTTVFTNDLSHFKIARIRIVGDGEAVSPISEKENSYRLISRLETEDQNSSRLYLSIDDTKTDTLIWSREVQLPTGRRETADALIPILGEINGPMGIIAAHDTIMSKERNDGGYPCLLKYLSFMRTREESIEGKVTACFKKPVKEQRMEATILAARAMFAIEHRGARNNFDVATDEAISFARAALAADPHDGSANFAMARFSYLKKDCTSARFYTSRTVEANPNNPVFMATLAGLAKMCNYPDAEKLLDRAFRTQSPYFAKGRLLLILGALGQDRPEKIAELVSSDLPQARYNRINYYLAESLIAASQGRRDDAVRYWQLFSETIPPGGQSAEEKLRPIVALPAMRRRLVAYLESTGVIPDDDVH